jgi:small subunit ribosomal protein S16
MLVIRMQRVGRKGLPQYRIVVQDSQRTPTSGKVVKLLGRHNPHSKETVLDKELAAQFLENGAQPSVRVARLLESEGVKLPKWFVFPESASKKTKHPEKLRKNAPAKEEAAIETPAEEKSEDEPQDISGEKPEAVEADVEKETKDEKEESSKSEEPAEDAKA